MLDVGVGPSVLVERGNKGYTGVSVHLGVCACSAYVVKCVNNTLGFMYHIEIALCCESAQTQTGILTNGPPPEPEC